MKACQVFDRVYGTIELPPLVAEISMSKEFQRLDKIRQLGGCAYIYPSATHTRREHSIGVSHIAGEMARHFQTLYPHLVEDDDVLCVQIAGLVHDLGHGPFSHLFEEYLREEGHEWDHEVMGLKIFELVLQGIEWEKHFATLDDKWKHMEFVKCMVVGVTVGNVASEWPEDLVGRPKAKRFLTSIVHNVESGIDVDKLDYLLRDSLAVFGSSRPFDPYRILAGAKVLFQDDVARIAFDESVAFNVAEIYALRARLHRQLYQHRTVVVIESALKRLMRELDLCLPQGEKLAIVANDPRRFVHLTDARIVDLPYETDSTLATANEIFQRLFGHPWLTRIPVTGSLRTTPVCRVCQSDTAFVDAFCGYCGESTRTRAGVDLGGFLVTQECLITEKEATGRMNELTGRTDVSVHITEISCGSFSTVTDPHGNIWRDYDPLRNVRFVTRDGTITHMKNQTLHVPGARHVRMAHCYLPCSSSREDIDQVCQWFVHWIGTVGQTVEDL
jgi:HD superfamily phosphohydrolase